MSEAKTVREAKLGEVCVFRGTLRPQEEGESLVSPVTKRPCLVSQLDDGVSASVKAVDLVFQDASGPWPILARDLAANDLLLLIHARSHNGPRGSEALLYDGDLVSIVAMPIEVKSQSLAPRSYRSGVQTQVVLGAPEGTTLNITRRGPGR